jgi:hypothetical protein
MENFMDIKNIVVLDSKELLMVSGGKVNLFKAVFNAVDNTLNKYNTAYDTAVYGHHPDAPNCSGDIMLAVNMFCMNQPIHYLDRSKLTIDTGWLAVCRKGYALDYYKCKY